MASEGPPIGIAAAATLACTWEATAPKPGNVYRGADFEDLTYVDLITCAAIVGPICADARKRGVGATVLAGVQATRQSARSNANLGILLLLAPLSAAELNHGSRDRIASVLGELSADDAAQVYAAIRLAKPGGLGSVDRADVAEEPPPEMTLMDVMRLAADRDLIAAQYASAFVQVFETADRIAAGSGRGWPLADAIVNAYLRLIADRPDSLIARKCGELEAQLISRRCLRVLETGAPGEDAYDSAVAELDFFLRSDGHRRNPGASADVTAAALFVLLREKRIDWPVRFYR